MSLLAGPEDATVLYQQETHVSNFITPTNLDNTLRVRRSDNLIWELWRSGTLHHRVRLCLHAMGFYGILRCGELVYDNHLITALVERWRRETHTFHLRVGEASITLQDVALIWGLTVDGDPIIGTDVSYKFSVWQRYCYDWLGFVPIQTDFRANSLKLSALHLHCTQIIIDDNSTDVEVTQYARCVAMMIIGGCMLPDSEGCVVKMIYLYFLQDIQKVRRYSWASAVLAFLYRELCAACTSEKQEIAGPLYILQIWAWSRMTPLCPDRLGYNLVVPSENQDINDIILPIPPYGARWKHVYCWTHTPTHSVRIIRDVLDKMGDGQFKWIVYDLDAMDVLSLPLECRHPTLWRSVCPLICFYIVEMYRPNRVLRQFGMSQNIPIPALEGDNLHECSRRGRKNYDWVKHHRLMVDAWDNRHNLIVERELIADFSTPYDYAIWYDSITRRFISPIDPQQIGYGYQPGDAYFRRVVRDETATLRNFFGGLSVDDQPREALIEAVKNTMKTADMLYEMSLRAPEQHHHHHASSSRRRRRQRVDDVDDTPSFSTPEWRESTTTQSPTTSAWPHPSHGDDPSHSVTTPSPHTLAWPQMSLGEGTSNIRAPRDNFYVPSSYTQWPHSTGVNVTFGLDTSHTPNEFQTPHQTYDPLFTELLLDEHRHRNEENRPDYNISPISYMGYSFPQSSSNVPANVQAVVQEDLEEDEDEEEEVEAQPLVRRSTRIPKERYCGTGHRYYRK